MAMTTGSVSLQPAKAPPTHQVWQKCGSTPGPRNSDFREKIQAVSARRGGPLEGAAPALSRGANSDIPTSELTGRPVLAVHKEHNGLAQGDERREFREGKTLESEEGLLPEVPNCDWVDPTARALLQWAPPPGAVVATPSGVPSQVLDQVALQLVRKVSVGQSTVHLQLGDGQLAGGAVLVTAGSEGLEIRITAPPGMDAAAFGRAVEQRLERRGLRIASIEVD